MNYNRIILIMILFFTTVTVYPQALFDAINEGNLENVKTIIETDPSQLNTKNSRGATLLIAAASKGNIEIAAYLIEKGANVNEVNNFKTTPLHFAAFSNFHEIVKLLVESGAEIDIKNNQELIPVYYAAANGSFESAKYLLEMGADFEFNDASGSSLLHLASDSGNLELVKYFIEKGLKWETADNFGKTPLYYAADKGNKEIVDLFISSKVNDFTLETCYGSSYLHAAANGGLVSFAKILMDKGLDVNQYDLFNLTPYSIAKEKADAEMQKLLIENGADTSRVTPISGDYFGMELPGTTPEIFAPGIISTPTLNERDVTISLEGDEFYFTRWPMDRLWNIMIAKRVNNEWGYPVPASFMKPYLHAEACFTQDDQKMFFISNRPEGGEGAASNWEIWFTEKINSEWNEPQLLGEEFFGGFYPTFTDDGTMYYTNSDAHIGRAYLVNDKYTNIETLGPNVNSPLDEYNSCIAPDESYLIFSVNGRDDSLGDGDLYICFRNEDGTWTKAKHMGNKINSWARDYCPAISRDGEYFFFSSRKYGTEDIFWVSTKIIDSFRD